MTNDKKIRIMEGAIERGQTVLIENLGDTYDAVFAPVISRSIIKRGKSRYMKLGDKELGLHKNFKLILHTKQSNPNYSPEVQAECTLINFSVTESGLEDQLLNIVVKLERPDLAAKSEELIMQNNEFKITLMELEADLLKKLSSAEGNILENVPLIENLEESKKISTEINEKIEIAKETQILIRDASEV